MRTRPKPECSKKNVSLFSRGIQENDLEPPCLKFQCHYFEKGSCISLYPGNFQILCIFFKTINVLFSFTFPNILYEQSLSFPYINQSLTPNLLPGHEYGERDSRVHMKNHLTAQKILAPGLEQKCRISLPSIPKEFVS